MLKKIYTALLIVLAIILLLLAGWICQLFLNWPVGSMYLWPIVAFSAWGLFVFTRKAWVKYRAAQRLKTQLPIQESAAPDPDWAKGVRQLLQAQQNQNQTIFALGDITLSENLPRLRSILVWLDGHVVEVLEGKRWVWVTDIALTRRLFSNLHQYLNQTLESNQIEFLSHIPGLSALLGKHHHNNSDLGSHAIHFIFGMPGSGKSTLLQRSSAGAQIGDSNPDALITPTDSCRFAYLQSGIMVEVSGRHVDPTRNIEESDTGWNSLLASITVDTNPQQIASVVVCISPEDLADTEAANTAEGIQIIRRRITDLMNLSGKRLAVYIVLTKVDLIGMGPLIKQLPAFMLAQPAGSLYPHENIVVNAASVGESVDEINRYLPWLTLRSVANGYHPKNSALDAMSGMVDIQKSLINAITNLFATSNYLQAPIYRGLFLSADLEKAGVSIERQSDAPRLAFGTGVINDVLARDHVFQPLSSYERALRRRRRLMWFGYYSAVVAIIVWLLAGYFYQANQMSRLKGMEMPATTRVGESPMIFVHSIIDMEPFVDWSLNRYLSNWNFVLPFTGTTQGIDEKIQQRFVKNYESMDVNLSLPKFQECYQSMDEGNNVLIGPTIDAMLGRIRIIEAVLSGQSLQQVLLLTDPSIEAMTFLYPDLPTQDLQKIDKLYYFYVYWAAKENDLFRVLLESRKFLESVALKDKSLKWVMPWAASQANVRDVYLSQFWAPITKPQGALVLGPYTASGQKVITDFLNRIDAQPLLKNIYGEQITPFLTHYQIEREVAWRAFVLGFDDGKNLLPNEASWMSVITTLNGSESPYVKLTNRIFLEYPKSDSLNNRPGWVSSLELIDSIQESAKKTSIFGKLIGKMDMLAASAELNNSKDGAVAKDLPDDSKLYGTYSLALNETLTSALSSKGEAATLAVNFSGLGTEPSIKSSKISDAMSALKRFEEKIGVKSQPWNTPVWVILEGPLNTTLSYAYNQAACNIQSAWNNNVIYPTKLVTTESEVFQKTYGDQGTLWSFIDNTAKPFLTSNGTNFVNKSVDGFEISWQETLIPFLNNAASNKRSRDAAVKKAELEDKLDNTKDNARIKEIDGQIADIEKDQAIFNKSTFTIKVEGLPVQSNNAVKTLPYGVSISLSCGTGQQRLTQLNFASSQNFKWQANSCGDTELQIFVGDQVLSKVWSGKYGFSQFLSAFQAGKKTFSVKKFPDQMAALEQLGIKQLDVVFKFTGASAFVTAAEKDQKDTDSLAKLKAEKAQLEKALTDRQVKKIAEQLDALTARQTKPPLPETVANCPF
jgi:type VI secretion system protein ImpL